MSFDVEMKREKAQEMASHVRESLQLIQDQLRYGTVPNIALKEAKAEFKQLEYLIKAFADAKKGI